MGGVLFHASQEVPEFPDLAWNMYLLLGRVLLSRPYNRDWGKQFPVPLPLWVLLVLHVDDQSVLPV